LIVAAFVDGWVDGLLGDHDPSVASNEVRTIIIAVIWIPYFNLSGRVRNTFLKGRDHSIVTVFE